MAAAPPSGCWQALSERYPNTYTQLVNRNRQLIPLAVQDYMTRSHLPTNTPLLEESNCETILSSLSRRGKRTLPTSYEEQASKQQRVEPSSFPFAQLPLDVQQYASSNFFPLSYRQTNQLSQQQMQPEFQQQKKQIARRLCSNHEPGSDTCYHIFLRAIRRGNMEKIEQMCWSGAVDPTYQPPWLRESFVATAVYGMRIVSEERSKKYTQIAVMLMKCGFPFYDAFALLTSYVTSALLKSQKFQRGNRFERPTYEDRLSIRRIVALAGPQLREVIRSDHAQRDSLLQNLNEIAALGFPEFLNETRSLF